MQLPDIPLFCRKVSTMRPVSALPVPSKSLLRFLRSHTSVHDNCINQIPLLPSRQLSDKTSCINGVRRRCISTTTRHNSLQQQHRDDVLARQHEQIKAPPAPRTFQYPTRTRHASTRVVRPQTSKWSTFWSRFRRKSETRQRKEQESPQSYEDASAQLFNLSRALARSPASNDLKLRCTEFDVNGNVTLVSGEFKKSELIAKYGLLPRDLRKIDSSVLPHILVRPTAILLNLLHLRVLIQSDRVLVFDAYGSTNSYTQSLFMYDLEGKLRTKPDPRATSTYLPYEFRALEAVLISVTSGLEAEFGLVRDPVTHILRELEEDIDREKLRHLLIHSKKLGTFEQKARLVRDAIDDLLEADDDLAAMYLTERKLTGQERSEDEHQEIEMLLESYHKICDEIVEISGNLISNIRNTEEVVKAILDANRNQLMLLEIKFSIGTLGLAGGTLIAGFYGMNLNNFIEETDWGFGAVTLFSFAFSGLICLIGMRRLGVLQKVRMFGTSESFGSSRSGWRAEAAQSDSQAYFQRLRVLQERGLWQQQGHNTGPGANPASGPVMWPGVDGLGMHKLKPTQTPNPIDGTAGIPPSQPRSQVSETRDQYGLRIHDDIDNTEERMRKDKVTQKGMKVPGRKR